jgi:hypothetical protein
VLEEPLPGCEVAGDCKLLSVNEVVYELTQDI